MDAILTAGGAPRPKEPLYELTQGSYKAMLDIQGKPMVQWVLDALDQAALVDRIILVGLPVMTDLYCDKELTLLPDQGSMLDNVKVGVDELRKRNPKLQQFLTVSSDIPTITPDMVDWMVRTVQETDHDVYYNVIERTTMESQFPGSKRTYIHLKGMEVCGGDLNALRASVVSSDNPLYRRLVDARKSSIHLASALGYDTLLLLLLRQLDLDEAARQVSKRLEVNGRAILCPYAEIGMDVDKPHQLDLVRSELARQKVA